MKFTPAVIFTDIRTFFTMARAVVNGRYKTPWKTVFWAVLCAVYFLSPLDVLPDIVPLLGFADDGAFVLFVLLLIHQDLDQFRRDQIARGDVVEAEITANQEPKK